MIVYLNSGEDFEGICLSCGKRKALAEIYYYDKSKWGTGVASGVVEAFNIPNHVKSMTFCHLCWSTYLILTNLHLIEKITGWRRKGV